MNTEQALQERSQSCCELCSSQDNLAVFSVPQAKTTKAETEQNLLLCGVCLEQASASSELNINHWRCLNDSMWSPIAAVQVMAWRQLSRLASIGETWAQDLLDTLYLEEDTLEWAQAGFNNDASPSSTPPTLDSNGAILNAGDTVTLIKDLQVKGAGFTAKRGTAVRNIALTDNPEHIEGRVNGTRIVLLSCYLKKSS